MKIAIPHWQGRLSPVFDVCGRLLVVETENGRESGRSDVVVTGQEPLNRVTQLKALEIDVLICGAISRYMEAALAAAGIRVLAEVCGPVEAVLAGFLARGRTAACHRMPGCRRRQCRHGRGRH
ncbi:MAG: NifB/NifX family molybdenum-iron cluster-binding protein [Desulfobacteraceae bacterium]|nr:NifB/NifX family molybdenum-iron cluster-binding protein [Desulfobacteraceae bacterium]